jgi:diaminopimelate epimerase
VRLTKHHGLGNDFLVALDPPRPLGPDDARGLCERHRGIGADGLIIGATALDGGADLVMTLWNADGSRAEMSGNGIRCLAQAEAIRRATLPTQIGIRTDAGFRLVDVVRTEHPLTSWANVEMGPATIQSIDADACRVDMGNPHLVLREGDVLAEGLAHPELNVEVIEVHDRNSISMVVHERGVGITEACGTGACAAAAAAQAWGLVDTHVRVTMPGGTVEVLLDASITLGGPATFIASVEVLDQ